MVSRAGPQKSSDPARGKKGSPDDIISKGKPEDSSRRTGATGSSPPGKVPVKRRVRTKGSVPLGTGPKVAAPSVEPEDDPDLQDIDPSLPGDAEEFPRGAPDVSSLEPRRIALPLPGQEVSKASLQYQCMLEKLNNDVELYKLHVKRYHMSPAQFRRKTSMLGLQERSTTSTTARTSVPMPPRPETLGAFRQWTEENNCIPKGIVGDQAFFTDPFMAYCKFHGVTPYISVWASHSQFGCSRELGRSWQRPWLTRWLGQGIVT